MMQGIGPEQMHNGNTLTADAFLTDKFDFILAKRWIARVIQTNDVRDCVLAA